MIGQPSVRPCAPPSTSSVLVSSLDTACGLYLNDSAAWT